MRAFQPPIATQRRISLTAGVSAQSLAFGCVADCDVWAKDLGHALRWQIVRMRVPPPLSGAVRLLHVRGRRAQRAAFFIIGISL
jgi:hypothetical protein